MHILYIFQEKCHQYFPTIRETFTYENMSIRCSMELDYRTYTQRTLVLQKVSLIGGRRIAIEFK